MENKIDNLMRITKPFNFKNGDQVTLLADFENAWSNNHFADLIGLGTKEYLAKATIKGIETHPQKPNLKPILPEGGEVATDIEFDLESNNAILISENMRVKVNPVYLRYFNDVYKSLGYLRIELTGEKSMVKIKLDSQENDELIGVIMPINK